MVGVRSAPVDHDLSSDDIKRLEIDANDRTALYSSEKRQILRLFCVFRRLRVEQASYSKSLA